MAYKVISVGGSIIIPKTGFDPAFLKSFRQFILRRVNKGEKFILVIGGGGTCRQYQDAASSVIKMSNDELDWLGIHVTVLNAQFVKMLFGDLAYKDVITDPRKRVKTSMPLIIAAGWKPGASTDMDTVLLAKAYGAKELLNLSNIEYVYDKDPAKYKDAKKIEQMDWQTFRDKVVGHTWSAGKNAPFDPIASKQAQKLGLRVSILNGKDLKNVGNAIDGKKFVGTVIS